MAVTSEDPGTIAQRWASGMAGASAKVQAGVAAVTVAPGQRAAASQALYLANVQANAQKWAKNTAAVPLSTWQTRMNTKGIPRMGTGATAAQGDFATVMGKILAAERTIVGALPPRGTVQQNIQRSVTFMTKMNAQRGNFTK